MPRVVLVPRPLLIAVAIPVLIALAAGLYATLRARKKPTLPGSATLAWVFEARKRGAVVAPPLVVGDRVYLAALHDTAFINAGAVYCLEREGKLVWRFDDGGKMQHMFSGPCLWRRAEGDRL
jgi:hypothetical protein